MRATSASHLARAVATPAATTARHAGRPRRDPAGGGDQPPVAKRPVPAAQLGTLDAPTIPLEGDNPRMTPADAQQQRLLERLRDAGDQPVAFAEQCASGIAFPAASSQSSS